MKTKKEKPKQGTKKTKDCTLNLFKNRIEKQNVKIYYLPGKANSEQPIRHRLKHWILTKRKYPLGT